MDNHSISNMLSLITRPAFRVENGKITHVNPAAKAMQIEVGTEISTMLPAARDAYAEFREGCLYLPLQVYSITNGASDTKVDGADIFIVEDTEASAQLNALSLAGIELRSHLSDLNAILENTAWHRKDSSPEALTREGYVHRSLHKMLRIVNNMSDAAYWGKGIHTFSQMDVAAFYNEVMEKTVEYLSQAGITLSYKKAETPLFTRASKEMLERAIYNLVSNAAKFSDPGTPLAVTFSHSDKQIAIMVENTAKGLSADNLINAFNQYLRKSAAQEAKVGIGLGITFVRSAALAHNGTVLIQPTGDQTTKVIMTIAMDKDEDTVLRSNSINIDYTGGKDMALIELSELLPPATYQKETI